MAEPGAADTTCGKISGKSLLSGKSKITYHFPLNTSNTSFWSNLAEAGSSSRRTGRGKLVDGRDPGADAPEARELAPLTRFQRLPCWGSWLAAIPPRFPPLPDYLLLGPVYQLLVSFKIVCFRISIPWLRNGQWKCPLTFIVIPQRTSKYLKYDLEILVESSSWKSC